MMIERINDIAIEIKDYNDNEHVRIICRDITKHPQAFSNDAIYTIGKIESNIKEYEDYMGICFKSANESLKTSLTRFFISKEQLRRHEKRLEK